MRQATDPTFIPVLHLDVARGSSTINKMFTPSNETKRAPSVHMSGILDITALCKECRLACEMSKIRESCIFRKTFTHAGVICDNKECIELIEPRDVPDYRQCLL